MIVFSPNGKYIYGAGSVGFKSPGLVTELNASGSFDKIATGSGPEGIVADQLQTTLTASHHAPLTLTLTAGASNTPLAGQTLTFTAGGQSCTTTTHAGGQAGECESDVLALTSGFEVTYAGNADYQSANVQTPPLDEILPPPV